MLVAYLHFNVSLMEASDCSAWNNASDGDFGKNFWQKRHEALSATFLWLLWYLHCICGLRKRKQ